MTNHNLRGIGIALPARALALGLVAALALSASLAAAKPMARPVMIGVLTPFWGITPSETGMVEGLEKLGYLENRDFFLGIRFTSMDFEALPGAAEDLLRDGAQIIVATGTDAARAAARASRGVPVVWVGSQDPVETGLVASYARPGGKITGVTTLRTKTHAKALEVFTQLVPAMRRVLFPLSNELLKLLYKGKKGRQVFAGRSGRLAKILGIELIVLPIRSTTQAHEVLGRLRKGDVDGIFSVDLLHDINTASLKASRREKIPVMAGDQVFLERGAFATYGASARETGRQAARLIDKIIRGEDPANIPVEVNNTVELVINLKVARELGIEVPKKMLYRAERIIR